MVAPNPQAAALADIAALQQRVDTNLVRLQSDAASFHARYSTLAAGFGPSQEHAIAASAARLRSAVDDAAARHERRLADAASSFDTVSVSAEDDVWRALEAIAPGAASAKWGDDRWRAIAAERAPADFLRFGQLTFGDTVIPAIAPLAPGSGWYLTGEAEHSQDLQFSTVLRIAAQSPISNLTIDVFDPRMSARLAPLSPLRTLNDRAFPPPQTQGDLFARRIEQIVAAASANAERVVTGGARSLTQLWRSHDTYEGTLNVVVVLDYPYGVDRQLQTALRRLAALGPAAGAILLVQEDSTVSPAQDVVPTELRHELVSVHSERGTVVAQGFPDTVEVRQDDPPTLGSVNEVLQKIKLQASSDQGPVIPLQGLIAESLSEPWTTSSIDAIEMIIGRSGRELLDIKLRTENPPHPNLLIGGAVGTGKSNLLLDLIYSSAIAHSPDELDLILLDFKRGLEFKRFDADENGEGWLPHVSVLSLESNQEFGVAVLDHVNDEMERRADLFKNSGGYQSINAYRRETGEVLPRLLLVIDEFHILFDGDERLTETAVARLETIAKQGRAYGIHLLLASQTLSGISGLRAKGQSIFAQFPLRVSLKNTPDESQAILAAHNSAAADLVHRGEVVVNRNFGSPASNERGIAAFVEADTFAEVQRRLWNLDRRRRPLVFLGRQFADWEMPALHSGALTATEGSLQLWIGRPIRVTSEPAAVRLKNDISQAVAILGPDHEREPVVPSLVASMIVSASHQLAPHDSIVVLDGTGSIAESLAASISHAARQGVSVTVVPAASAADYLRNTLGTRTRDSHGTVLAIVLGVQRIPGLDDSEVIRPPADDENDLIGLRLPMMSMDAPREGTARAALQQLAKDGALRGVHLVGWWSTVAALSSDLGGAHNGVSTYLTASLGAEDLKYITNAFAARVDGHPRIGLLDRNSAVGLRSVVPFRAWNSESENEYEAGR